MMVTVDVARQWVYPVVRRLVWDDLLCSYMPKFVPAAHPLMSFLCMNVHMRVCVWRAEVTVLPHDNRIPKEPLASVLVLQSHCLLSHDLTPLTDVKGVRGKDSAFHKRKKKRLTFRRGGMCGSQLNCLSLSSTSYIIIYPSTFSFFGLGASRLLP